MKTLPHLRNERIDLGERVARISERHKEPFGPIRPHHHRSNESMSGRPVLFVCVSWTEIGDRSSDWTATGWAAETSAVPGKYVAVVVVAAAGRVAAPSNFDWGGRHDHVLAGQGPKIRNSLRSFVWPWPDGMSSSGPDEATPDGWSFRFRRLRRPSRLVIVADRAHVPQTRRLAPERQ